MVKFVSIRWSLQGKEQEYYGSHLNVDNAKRKLIEVMTSIGYSESDIGFIDYYELSLFKHILILITPGWVEGLWKYRK